MEIKKNTDVRKFRDKYGITQQKLFEMTGIHIPDISNLEHGRIYLYPEWKKKLNKAKLKLERGKNEKTND